MTAARNWGSMAQEAVLLSLHQQEMSFSVISISSESLFAVRGGYES